MSLDSFTQDFEKDYSVTVEQIFSQLMTKDNLPLKTEIPFHDAVEMTAMIKEAYHLVGELFMDVEIIDDNNKLSRVEFDIKNKKGEILKIPFGQLVTSRLSRSITYSEEYAVSHNRQGRKEVAGMISKKVEDIMQTPVRQDTLSKFQKR